MSNHGPSGTDSPSIHVIPVDAPEAVLVRLPAEFTVGNEERLSGLSHARCLLAVALALDRADVRARLQEIRRQHPATPLVIITSGDSANLQRLLGLSANSVVTLERIEDELASVVRSMLGRSPLEVAAAAFERADSLDDVVRTAVITALRALPPIHTVKALAKRVGVSPNRLAERFRPIRLRTGWSCLDLLHAVALWRTSELMRAGASVKRASQDLDLDVRTIRRVCRAHIDCAPSDLIDCADALGRAVLDFAERSLSGNNGRKD